MADDVKHTTAPLPDHMLRGEPKQQPCAWCGASRTDQVSLSYAADDDTPLCEPCWTLEYGEDFERTHGKEPTNAAAQ